jgi:hypothetical protein
VTLRERDVPMPTLLSKRPTQNGFVVPWFVWRDPATGRYDFRITRPGAVQQAAQGGLCWVCGGRLDALDLRRAFVAGPMCCVNRISAEPPMHVACATYAARACPFLVRPHAVRGGRAKPAGAAPLPGHLDRNPGVAMVWVYDVEVIGALHVIELPPTDSEQGGWLFQLPEPTKVKWFAEGGPATREQVEASIASGLPLLLDACDMDADPDASRAEVMARLADAQRFLPKQPAVTS